MLQDKSVYEELDKLWITAPSLLPTLCQQIFQRIFRKLFRGEKPLKNNVLTCLSAASI